MKRVLLPAAFAAVLGLSAAVQAQTVGIATSNPGSLLHNIGTAVAKAANEGGLNATIQPATSPNQYVALVNLGDVEFGVSNLQEFNYALEGKGWFAGRVNPNLRIVGLIMPIREAIFVRRDSGIKTIADLNGKPMVDGYTAQQTILPQLDAMYATAGLSRRDMKPVQVPSVTAGADSFMAGETVGFIFAHGAGKVREADASVGGLRALPIPNTPEALAVIRRHWSTGYLTKMAPSPNTPGVEEEAWFLAYPQLVFTNAKTKDDVVYKMTKVLFEGQASMGATFPAFKEFNPKEHMVGDTAPGEYHPGAIRFFQEAGLWKK
jgi:TRAP transporter TAXI family solute receptor